MTDRLFSDGALVRMGWVKAKEHIGTYIAALFVSGLAVFVPASILMVIGGGIGQIEFFLFLAFISYLVMGAVMGAGSMRLFLNAIDGKEVSVGILFSEWKRAFPYALVCILYAFVVMVGLCLFIIPGVIWSLKYLFAPMLVLDGGMKPMDAMRASALMTDGLKWDLLGFQQVIGTVVIIGYLVFFVGVVVSIPVAMIAVMGLYRHLSPMKNSPPQSVSPASMV
ncbi:hypothetical protein HQ487_03930 [Candidatus Uhrbacteria bacterium]|nr:hypothetical protein [Candidatus Uhrbacteria bacterium]